MWSQQLPYTTVLVAVTTFVSIVVLPTTFGFTVSSLLFPSSGSTKAGRRPRCGCLTTYGMSYHANPTTTSTLVVGTTHLRMGVAATPLLSEIANATSFSSSRQNRREPPTSASTVDEDKTTWVEHSTEGHERFKLQGKLLKQIRKVALDYNMFEEGDHIMVCVSGGKDSATLLYLLRHLQQTIPINFQITAVHVDQHQPGYNGTTLVQWLRDELHVPYKIVSEDTYSIVIDKTPANKSYCTVCSRLRRGILYSTAMELQCNKLVLGHHGDDALETLFLNMIHAGQTKSMPARYTSTRGRLAVMRPLITCLEDDIARYAALSNFPILPCNLCSNQGNMLQRPQVKLLLSALTTMSPNAKRNMLTAISDIRPSHLLDPRLRQACGMDPITGEVIITDESCGDHGHTMGEEDYCDDEDALLLKK